MTKREAAKELEKLFIGDYRTLDFITIVNRDGIVSQERKAYMSSVGFVEGDTWEEVIQKVKEKANEVS